MKYWLFLALAIVFEVAGTFSMKFSNGFANLTPSVLIFIFYAASFAALTVALQKIELGIAYAIWAGVGTALIVIIGIFYFKEAASLLKFICILLIILGVIGLHISNTHQ